MLENLSDGLRTHFYSVNFNLIYCTLENFSAQKLVKSLAFHQSIVPKNCLRLWDVKHWILKEANLKTKGYAMISLFVIFKEKFHDFNAFRNYSQYQIFNFL